ncbi:MAG: transposase [Bacteroidales bacterium]|nr:transposase [Bacteroidales bacterium]
MTFIRKIRRGNRVYLAEVKSYRIDGKVKQKLIKYIGVDHEASKENLKFAPQDIIIKDVKVYGPMIVLEHISRELGFYELLGDIAKPILSLVFAHCLNYKSTKEVENWFKKTDLSHIMNVENINSKELYSAVEELSKMNTDWLQKSIFENITKLLGKDDSGIIYDATNTHLAGKRSGLAMKGKDKEGVRGRKLIQIGLGVTRTHGFPIFHHARAGNIHDINMFKEAIYHFNSLGTKNGIMVFDRGMTSKESISKLTTRGWKVLAGVPLHKGIKSAITNMDIEKIKSFRNLVVQGDTEFFVKGVKFKMGDVTGKLLILLNANKRESMARRRRLEINRAKKQLHIDPEKIEDDSIMDFFNSKNKINHHAIKRSEKNDGLSFLFTNAKINNEDAVHMYFAKDLVEQCFKEEKNVLNMNPIRFWLDDKIKSHLLICHLGLVLLTTIRFRLRKAALSLHPSTALGKLDSIYRIYCTGKDLKSNTQIDFERVNTMSRKQSQIIQIIAPTVSL